LIGALTAMQATGEDSKSISNIG